MIESIEAFLTLVQKETMSAAAIHLRVTQSAISKRIATLEGQLNKKLIEKHGRKVRLTGEGQRFAKKAAPLLAEWKSLIMEETQNEITQFVVGVSESILSSWGAEALFSIQRQLSNLELEVHAHRSPLVIERVESGNFHFGISAGLQRETGGLIVEEIWQEPMVLIPARLIPVSFSSSEKIPIVTIEKASATWQALEAKAKASNFEVKIEIESFRAAAQMAIAGYAHGLIPFSIAENMKISPEILLPLFHQKMYRPIQIVTRKSIFQRDDFQKFLIELRKEIEKVEKKLNQYF